MDIYALLSGMPTVKDNPAKYAVMKSLHGIGERMWWHEAEPSPGKYSFKPIIDALEACLSHGKTAHVTVLCGVHTCDWIKQKIGKGQLIATSDGAWPNPANAFVRERFQLMTQAFCKALVPYEKAIDFIHLSGPQVTKSNEIHIKAAVSKTVILDAWKQSIADFRVATMVFKKSMPLCLNLSVGRTDNDGIREAVAQMCFESIGGRLVMQHNALDGKTNTTTFKTHTQLLQWGKKGVVIGCEAKQPSNHPSFNGTFNDMLKKAKDAGLSYLTIYNGDSGKL